MNSATNLQPEYTQSHQVRVASGKVAVHKTNFQLLSYSSWDLDELVAAMDSSELIKDLFIGSSMISLYNILAEYFETFIHKEDERIDENTLKFVLDTLADLQKEVKEKKPDTLWVWSHTKKIGIDLILTFAIE